MLHAPAYGRNGPEARYYHCVVFHIKIKLQGGANVLFRLPNILQI